MLRLERDAWSMVEWLKQATNECPPPQTSSTRKVRKSAPQVVLCRMQLTLHVTRRVPHGASRLGARYVSLFGENPTCFVPAL